MSGAYNKFPKLAVPVNERCAWRGWTAVLDRIREAIGRGARRVSIECYPGVFLDRIESELTQALPQAIVVLAASAWKCPAEIESMTARELTDDPVFGRMNGFVIDDFLDPKRLDALRDEFGRLQGKAVILVGTGAMAICREADLLIYADLPRWEIQRRQRAGLIGNLGLENRAERPALKYKRGFFLDWRVADRIKRPLLDKLDYLLDTTDSETPTLLTGDAFRAGLRLAATRPFRLKPFFDPGPWGGQWMREICGLGGEEPNFAWCFDCVPEENSLVLEFGGICAELPAIDLVFQHPRELLGDPVHARFGTEFPIRFDFLDTMGGGNLSLQVHPLTEYIQDRFGMHYTQDESYYLLDAGPDAAVYLGLKKDIDSGKMIRELRQAQAGADSFDAERYVNKWPARKHDHFLIPAGTIHCSGRNSMVLEISATPYIFTFKMWDWGRLGLDGRPRPIHLDHGISNVQWDRDTEWVRQNLINRIAPVAEGPGWIEERTGLHEREFIETRRLWFEMPIVRCTGNTVHVLNLVQGEAAIVDSPSDAFEPLIVHYAETFVVPAAVGTYRIQPRPGTGRCATICASVRS
ncbi:MAG: class I mannose-6-phosphate isomerase [Candidatus Acidiferrales bacterium]